LEQGVIMPTALELTRKEWRRYRKPVAQKSLQRASPAPVDEEAVEPLLIRIRQAAATLKSQFAVRRVILFGSLAHAASFAPDSDVDMVIEGLPPEDYWRAWRAVEEIIKDRPVDLIEIETASDSLRRAIDRYGIDL
jgi:uncharacterized protein